MKGRARQKEGREGENEREVRRMKGRQGERRRGMERGKEGGEREGNGGVQVRNYVSPSPVKGGQL